MSEDSEKIKRELEEALKSGAGPKVVRFALACLSGVPYIGSVAGAGAGAWSDAEQDHFKKILGAWIRLQEDEIKEIGTTLMEVMARVDKTDENVRQRIESPEYLSLVKKCFRDWSASESEEKRILIRNLLSNAAGGEKLCGDDVLRLFVEWIDRYSEGHFRILREVHQQPGITRQEIWLKIHGSGVREDSPQADLFRLLMHDLSLGRIIRQHREKDYQGNFYKTKRPKSSNANPYMSSAFDDEKEYEITELGRWFVHYTMNEIVPKIAHHTVNSQ